MDKERIDRLLLLAINCTWATDAHGVSNFDAVQYARLVAEECARVCGNESVVMATRDQTRGAMRCMQVIREHFGIASPEAPR